MRDDSRGRRKVQRLLGTWRRGNWSPLGVEFFRGDVFSDEECFGHFQTEEYELKIKSNKKAGKES